MVIELALGLFMVGVSIVAAAKLRSESTHRG